jgi:hypothetical protein
VFESQKAVSFSEKLTQTIPTPPHHDLTDAERHAASYHRSDYDQFRHERNIDMRSTLKTTEEIDGLSRRGADLYCRGDSAAALPLMKSAAALLGELATAAGDPGSARGASVTCSAAVAGRVWRYLGYVAVSLAEEAWEDACCRRSVLHRTEAAAAACELWREAAASFTRLLDLNAAAVSSGQELGVKEGSGCGERPRDRELGEGLHARLLTARGFAPHLDSALAAADLALVQLRLAFSASALAPPPGLSSPPAPSSAVCDDTAKKAPGLAAARAASREGTNEEDGGGEGIDWRRAAGALRLLGRARVAVGRLCGPGAALARSLAPPLARPLREVLSAKASSAEAEAELIVKATHK